VKDDPNTRSNAPLRVYSPWWRCVLACLVRPAPPTPGLGRRVGGPCLEENRAATDERMEFENPMVSQDVGERVE
jgi:hypothetical protein